MLTDDKDDKNRSENVWDRLSQKRPIVFCLLLVVMTAAVTCALLWQSATPFVLYQGF